MVSTDFAHLSTFGQGKRIAGVGLLFCLVTIPALYYGKRKGTLNSSRLTSGRVVVIKLMAMAGVLQVLVGLIVMAAS